MENQVKKVLVMRMVELVGIHFKELHEQHKNQHKFKLER